MYPNKNTRTANADQCIVGIVQAFAQRGFTLADTVVSDIQGVQRLMDEVETVRTEDLDLPQLNMNINVSPTKGSLAAVVVFPSRHFKSQLCFQSQGLKDFLTLLINPSVVKQELTQLNTAVSIVASDVPQLALGVTSLTVRTLQSICNKSYAMNMLLERLPEKGQVHHVMMCSAGYNSTYCSVSRNGH
jgi:hypothetical protein